MDIPLSPLLPSMHYGSTLMQGNENGFSSQLDTATSDWMRTALQFTPDTRLNKDIMLKTQNIRMEMQQAIQEKHLEGLKNKQAFQQVANKLKQMKDALDSIG